MYRNVEVQLGQIANTVNNRNQGNLPSKAEVNPREHAKAITLRSGKEVGEPPVIENERECQRRENKQLSELGEDGKKIKGKERMEENEPQIKEITPIPPPAPFPQRLKPSRNDKEFEKFVNIVKQLHINIPFVDTILQIPSYAKFLKKIMTKKRKLVDSEIIALTEECNVILQNKLPPKLKDPRSFTVPCTIGNVEFSKALCDLGASVSLIPLTVVRQLELKELKRTNISLQLADKSIRHPMDILENVLIKVQKFIIPIDFVVLDMEEDVNAPIILGRPFLTTAGTIIDVKRGKFKFQIDEEEVEFDLSKVEKCPSFTDHVHSVDICDELALEMSQVNLDDDSLELCLNGVGLQEKQVEKMIEFLQAQVPYKRRNAYEELGLSKGLPSPSCEQAPQLKFKPLPKHLKYAFLREKETLSVIVNAALDEEQLNNLLRVLRKHLKAIGWTISDIKGISPTICMHRILLEENSKPVVKTQRRLNPNMKEVKCEETNLVLNGKKCHFMICEGIILDHKISSEGIEVDQAKIEVIERMPPPINVKSIRNFLGYVGFYRRFIKDFSKTVKPLCELLTKDVPFHFNDECLLAFNKLKKELVSAPIIASLDWNLPFELMCDASDFAVGAVFGQKYDKRLHVIYYASKMLNETQVNYATTEKELLAVIFALDKFKSYLVGSKVIIYTDHAALKYLLKKKDAKPRLIRWILLLQEFDLAIKDKKGFENLVADHLSRLENMPQEDHSSIKEEFSDEFLMTIYKSPWFGVPKAIISDEGTMVRTRRARIRTFTPSSSEERTPSHEESPEEESPSPEPPPRSRWKTASTSRDEPLPDYDTTRFTSLENQQWYEAGLDKETIIEKNLTPEVDAHYHISTAFKRLRWENIFQLPKHYYPNLVQEFYANVENK
ncbi:uncharacterized protein [Coffea arabica]|uniref:RNA-directed DNA polymerase n=1 Tax=Coffea arabica TaxID=13443 RepID=A0A6P6S9X3_COFAR